MVLDRAEARDLREAVGRELQHVGHDAEIGLEALQGVVRLRLAQRFELEHLEPLLLRGSPEGVGLGARFFRRAEHASDVIPSRKKRVQDRLAEILLPDDRDFHGSDSFLVARCSSHH